MKKMILAYNPVSGHADFKNRFDIIAENLQRRNVLLQLYRTTKQNENFAAFLKAANADGIIVAGGDGTLHNIVNLLKKNNADLPVGIIGCGTSNDFASYLKIDLDSQKYFDAIADGNTRRIDLGETGGEYFINVASAGMMTAIAHEVDARFKNAIGKLAYYIRGIKEIPKFKTMPLNITADGKNYELDAFLFLILNSSVVGSMKNVAEAARIDDGKLDLLAVKKSSAAELMKLTADLIAGKSVMTAKNVLHIAAAEFVVETDGAEEAISDLDGEKGPALPITVKTLPGALEIFCL